MFWNKKKKSKMGSIELGLDVKRCAECFKYTRLCWVSGDPATFHRWVEDERALLKVDIYTTPDEQRQLVHRFREEGVIAPGCSVEKHRCCWALIEWPDGRVEKVAPERVRFLDREEPADEKHEPV